MQRHRSTLLSVERTMLPKTNHLTVGIILVLACVVLSVANAQNNCTAQADSNASASLSNLPTVIEEGETVTYTCRVGYSVDGLSGGSTVYIVQCGADRLIGSEQHCTRIDTPPSLTSQSADLHLQVYGTHGIYARFGSASYDMRQQFDTISTQGNDIDAIQSAMKSQAVADAGRMSSLSANIDSEAGMRTQADLELQVNIDKTGTMVGTEVAARSQADQAITDRANILSSSVSTSFSATDSAINLRATVSSLAATAATINGAISLKADTTSLTNVNASVYSLKSTVNGIVNIPGIEDMAGLQANARAYADSTATAKISIAQSVTESRTATNFTDVWTTINRILACNQNGQIYNVSSASCYTVLQAPVSFATGKTCNTASTGTLNYDPTKGLVVCNGTAWVLSYLIPLGSSALNPALSCQAIVDAKSSVGSGKYFISITGVTLNVWCDMSKNPAVNMGGDGSTIALASASCSVLKTNWLFTKGPAYVIISGFVAYRYCNDGQDYGGDGSTQAYSGNSCTNITSANVWAKPINAKYWINGANVACSDGTSSSFPANSCVELLRIGKSSGTYYLLHANGSPVQAYCEMSMGGGGWMVLFSNDLSCGCGEFDGNQWGSPNSGSNDYRFPATGPQLTAMTVGRSSVSRASIFTRTLSGYTQAFTDVTNVDGFSGTCASCNCPGNQLSGNVYWHGGRGGCYGSTHFGLADGSDMHITCGGGVQHWGHFHIGGDNTGDYQFGTQCINRSEWAERFVYYIKPQ